MIGRTYSPMPVSKASATEQGKHWISYH